MLNKALAHKTRAVSNHMPLRRALNTAQFVK